MRLDLIRHLWGITMPWETAFPRIKQLGYVGVEVALPAGEQRGRLEQLVAQHGFSVIPQIFTRGATVDEHLRSFREQVTAAKSLAPAFINCHGGSDRWNFAEAKRFYAEALAIEQGLGCLISHETHRGRIMYNPWVTRDLLLEFPALRLTCDFSHWVCVAERLIDSELEIIRLCAGHAHHVHARVGYEQGPQVPDPRAPEYRAHLEAHERWWDLVWDAQRARGLAASTLTPEFGPPAYLHTLPHTDAPVADLWEICEWQAQRQAQRFAQRAGGMAQAR